MKITIVLDGEQIVSGEAKEWLIAYPHPGNVQIAINLKLDKPKKRRREIVYNKASRRPST